MNNKRQRNRLFTMLLLVMAILMPYGGAWAQTMPSSGNGEVDSPYIITTAEELKWFRDEVNRGRNNICAKIADNVEVIDMSTVCHAADKSQNLEEVSWEPIGNTTNRYMGTFDGNNKTITNLYINANQEYSGLFGYTYRSAIKNLTFVNANVTNTNSFTGILVGYGYGGTYQNIMTSTSCEVNGGDGTGGIAGKLAGNAYNCVNYATVQGKELVGGLFSSYDSSTSITACANYGKVTASSLWVGGLVGYFNSGTIQDCANYGDVKGANCVAGMVGFVDQGKIQNVFSYGNVSATMSTQNIGMAFGSGSGTTEGMVAYYSGAKLTANGQEKDVKAFGNGTPSEDKATGFTETQLKSGFVAYQLHQNASSEAKWGQNLANDGDIYPVIGSEHTVYADNSLVNCKTNEKISGSFTNNPSSSAIRYKHGTTIHHAAANATCTEAATKEYWQCQDCQRIYSDCQLTVELTDVTDAEHPALGHDNNEDGYCKRCQHYVAVKPSEENGVYLIAKPCHLAWFRDYVNGTIVDEGGVAGTTHPSASAMLTADIDLKNYCHAAEDGKELLSWIPIGYFNNSWRGNMDGQGHTISHLYIKTAQNYVGLFGYTYGATIQDLIFDNAKVENVSTTNTKTAYTGILAGYAYGALSHIKGIKTTNNCTVIGQQFTGGIVGYAKINLENCDNHSSVKGTDNVGGIAGSSAEINIRRSTNYGTVENNNTSIGGIIGYAYGTSIEDCANYGKISSTGWYTGGIAGQTEANCSIQNVFSYGDVTNTNEVPEIIIGYVKGTLTAKGIVAYNKEALLNNSSENIKKVVGRGSLTFEDGKEEADVVKAFTQQQIKSGEVAYLLAEGKVLGEKAWGQQLGKDQYPVLGSDYKVVKAAQGDKDANGNDTYWATFSNPTNDVTLSVPSDRTLKVYNATVSGGKMTLTQRSNNQVAKEEGVLLKTDGEYVNAKANATNELAKASSYENHLVATPAEAKTVTAETGCKLYRLTYKNATNKERLGFYLSVDKDNNSNDGTSLKATPGKAYLQVSENEAKDPSSAALARSFVFGGGNETTGIEGITIMGTDVQRHGTIEGIFDLQGRKISNPTKGIYIKNNKKVIIK